MILPEAFTEKMKLLLGEEYESYLACFEEERHYGLRVNTAKISVKDFLRISPWKLRPISWIDNGFYYDGEKEHPAKHPYYFAGLFYLQEPSAMTPANRLPVEVGERVLDVCAAPGGKATELAAKLNRSGVLAANDISSSRARGLLKNLELFGIGNALVFSEEPGKLLDYFPEYFDKILIDAPCSGEGMFRKDRRMTKAWEEHGPEFFCKIQKSIILQASAMLRPGGMLLYSTCTFDMRENEEVILHLLHQCPEFQICDIRPYEGFAHGFARTEAGTDENLRKTVRIYPHRMEGEGHFLALLQKKESSSECNALGSGSSDRADISKENLTASHDTGFAGRRRAVEIPSELESFFKHMSWKPQKRCLELRGERVYYMPEGLPDIRGIRFLRTGLLMGELKKNRFEPSQALAMFLKKEEYAFSLDLCAEDERVIKYLKGETLDVEDLLPVSAKGWYLICVDGYPLGWGKAAGGRIKNKYLPGWRWQS